MKILLHRLFLLVAFGAGILPLSEIYGSVSDDASSRYATDSRLASGKWIKLKVTDNASRLDATESAIYKLTYDDIKKLGIEDPSKVNVYGYGGWILDQDFTKPYVDDLPEVSVYVNKGSDGVFGAGDYILFYGRGTRKWTHNSSEKEYVHQNNPYATYGCYFLTQGERGPKEMSLEPSVSGSEATYSVFDDYALHEQDQDPAQDANSGRELFGESFTGGKTSRTFNFSFPGVTSDTALVRLSFAAKALSYTPVSLSIDGKRIINGNVSPIGDRYFKGSLFNDKGSWNDEKKENVNVVVEYNAGSQTFAALDYIRFNVKRELRSYGVAYTFFRNSNSLNKTVTYTIKNATANLLVFEVTDNFNSKLIDTKFSNNELSFTVHSGSVLREFVLVDPGKSFSSRVESLGEVKNQDLHSLPQTDMVIITPQIFKAQSEKLAEEHRKRDDLHVTVVTSDEVYNEFSSGVYDITAYRRFMKMFYDRAHTEEEKPKYLLLFGDGVFDNRFLSTATRSWNRDNFLLTYQVKESLNEYASYGTDDYVGFLDDGENLHPDSTFNSKTHKLDLGIGRFPVRTTDQADDALIKLIGYMDNTSRGSWKNSICFSADDTGPDDQRSPFLHTKQANDLANYMSANHPQYMVSKVYMDAYKKSLTNGRTTYPGAKQKLNDVLKTGCLVYNYTGHGSVTDLSAENMANVSDINQMNFTNLPLWITATCDFSWHDAVTTSGGETVFLNKKSAGIALISTTRVVYSNDNYQLNLKLITNLFKKDENGKYPRLGDVLKKSKNAQADANQLNFILLGDPALKLNYPEETVELQEINGIPVDPDNEYQFKAFEQVTLSGVIRDASGEINTDFNGVLRATIFDSQQLLKTIYVNPSNGEPLSFTDYPNVAFTGGDSVKNGAFSFAFMVPLDISYTDNNGKMNFYATSSNGASSYEANGKFERYKLNGTSDSIPLDDIYGPEIEYIYLNTPEFKAGDVVNSTPYFYAGVYDENGINMSGNSLGHDITISIDNSTVMTYNMNQYFEPESGKYGAGTIRFSIPEMPEGRHTLVFRVWDLLNNSSTDSLEFYVDPALKPQIYDLMATQNPAREATYFLLSSDRPETSVNLKIHVFDLNGRQVWSHQENNVLSNWDESYPIKWDLRSDKGSRVQPGVYVYRAAISSENSKEATKAKKIIVLGQ